MMTTGSDVTSFAILVSVIAVCPGIDTIAYGKRNDEKDGFCRDATVTIEEVVSEHVGSGFRLEWGKGVLSDTLHADDGRVTPPWIICFWARHITEACDGGMHLREDTNKRPNKRLLIHNHQVCVLYYNIVEILIREKKDDLTRYIVFIGQLLGMDGDVDSSWISHHGSEWTVYEQR